MPKKVIASESFDAVMDEVSKELKKLVDTPPDSKEGVAAFIVFLNTLRNVGEEVLEYLPAGERSDVLDMCGSWMGVGLLLGRAPKVLADILKRTKAKIEIK